MSKTISKAEAWKKIERTNGQVFGARVIKRTNGEERTFNCRLARTTSVGKVGGDLPYNAAQHRLIAVYEMANARPDPSDNYRMINVDGLLEVAIAGERFMVEQDDKA